MTSDPEVLETVKGLKIKFSRNPMTCSQKEQRYFSENENRAVDEELEKIAEEKGYTEILPRNRAGCLSNIRDRKGWISQNDLKLKRSESTSGISKIGALRESYG